MLERYGGFCKMQEEREVRYCKKCVQMTNHIVTKLPLMIDYECLKCEAKNKDARKRNNNQRT